MSINHLDVMRTQEASQLKHIENQRTQHAQEQIVRSFQTQIEKDHSKPKETTKSDDPEYRYDAKEKGNNQYYRSGSNKKDKKDKEMNKKDPLNSGRIDIRI